MYTDEGIEVLLHIGIDTSHLNGKYFKAHVKEGDRVEPGQLLIRFDLPKVKKHSKSIITPMIITNSDRIKSWNIAPFKSVKEGQRAVMSVILKEEATTAGGRQDV